MGSATATESSTTTSGSSTDVEPTATTVSDVDGTSVVITNDTSGAEASGVDTSTAETSTGGVDTSSGDATGSSTNGTAESSGDDTTTGADACALGCGGVELCDLAHAGYDDDCDGDVDEDCPCVPGLQQPCFRGDPSIASEAGCAAGVQSCVDDLWGPCTGGAHPIDDCADATPVCQRIATHPIVPVSLADAIGDFGDDAIAESWSVECPAGETTCPPATDGVLWPVVAGEHTITYAKTTEGGSDECTFVVESRKAGLHVELEWEHELGGSGVDLDLHLHQPDDTSPWAITGSNADCGWANCTADQAPFDLPAWFDGMAPPDPVAWWLFPNATDNTCYYEPLGAGDLWSESGLGCYNPRLGTPNLGCDPNVVDPDDLEFCHAERIDVDFPGVHSWYRVAVHYFSAHGLDYDVHPRVRIWCENMPAADLGPSGFYLPEAPVTFTPADGSSGFAGNRAWLVADVAVTVDECGATRCVVAPLYADADARTPWLTLDTQIEANFGPPYLPPP